MLFIILEIDIFMLDVLIWRYYHIDTVKLYSDNAIYENRDSEFICFIIEHDYVWNIIGQVWMMSVVEHNNLIFYFFFRKTGGRIAVLRNLLVNVHKDSNWGTERFVPECKLCVDRLILMFLWAHLEYDWTIDWFIVAIHRWIINESMFKVPDSTVPR